MAQGQPLKAAAWMVGAIASFTSMAVAARQVSNTLDTFEIMLFRSIVGVVIVVTILALRGQLHHVRTTRFGLHVTRNVAHFIGQNLWFYAIALIPLAQLFAFEFTTPIWVVLLSPLVLREPLTPVGLLTAGLGFIGVLMVAQPGASTFNSGMLAAAGCAIFFALTALFTKKLTEDQPITTILFYLTSTQLLFGLICAGYDGDVTLPTGIILPWILLIGVAGLLAHFCLTTALSLAPASIVMPIDFARLPIIALVGAVFYDEALSILVLFGGVVIFAANYLNIIYGSKKRAA